MKKYPITLVINPEFLSNLDLNNPEAIKTIASVAKIIISQDSSQLPDLLLDIEETKLDIIDFIKKNEASLRKKWKSL